MEGAEWPVDCIYKSQGIGHPASVSCGSLALLVDQCLCVSPCYLPSSSTNSPQISFRSFQLSSLMDGLKKIPASEVRLHTSKDSCWLVIHGKVYDVTKFLDDHPGGDEVLLHASGTGDASQSFEDVGHSSTARTRMTNYLIGELEGYDPSKAPRKASRATGGKAQAVQQKPSFGITDYLLPLFLLALAVVSWFLINDESSTA